MSKRHIPESHAAHPNVTPLIDVVMVLIVFFMLVAKIGVSTGADEKIKIPASILGIDIKDMEYRYLEIVLMACAKAHCKSVNFNTAKVTETKVATAQ
jgi:hypothetical protein